MLHCTNEVSLYPICSRDSNVIYLCRVQIVLQFLLANAVLVLYVQRQRAAAGTNHWHKKAIFVFTSVSHQRACEVILFLIINLIELLAVGGKDRLRACKKKFQKQILRLPSRFLAWCRAVWDQGTQLGTKKNWVGYVLYTYLALQKAKSGGKKNAMQHFDPFSGVSRPRGAPPVI